MAAPFLCPSSTIPLEAPQLSVCTVLGVLLESPKPQTPMTGRGGDVHKWEETYEIPGRARYWCAPDGDQLECRLRQGFQGGIRGAVKDSGGVVPGVEVTLTNEQTNIARSTTTNERGEYSFAAVDPGSYKIKVVLQGYKTVERGELRIATQSFLVLDLTMEVGAISESITVTGESPIIETANASQGTVLDTQALQTLPAPGRAAFLVGVSIPTVIPSGDGPVQPSAGSVQRVAVVAGRRHAPRQQLHTLDGVPITDITNPRGRQSDHRGAGRREGPGAHLRRGNGPHRWRRVQHDAQVRHEQLARHGVLPDAAGVGRGEQLLQPERRLRATAIRRTPSRTRCTTCRAAASADRL